MKKTIVLLVGLVFLSGCSTFGMTQKKAFNVVQSYCDTIPDIDRDMGIRFEIVKKNGREEKRVSIECRGGQMK